MVKHSSFKKLFKPVVRFIVCKENYFGFQHVFSIQMHHIKSKKTSCLIRQFSWSHFGLYRKISLISWWKKKKSETKQTLHLPQACFIFLPCCLLKTLALDKSSGLFGAEFYLAFLWKRLKTLAQLHHKSLNCKCQEPTLQPPPQAFSTLHIPKGFIWKRRHSYFLRFPFLDFLMERMLISFCKYL